MKKIIILILFFSFAFVNAQEKPAKKETKEERQQRYINEGNPFKKYGYTPKIATLSKGKYREFFTDSIITIGSFEYNRVTKRITGFTLYNKENLSEADLQPELVSRWMSPDPLSDEFPSWSPYNFVNNNPVLYIDPEGLAPENVIINGVNADKATADLNASTSLNITRDEKTGKLSATGEAKTEADIELQNAINDTEITVEVNAVDGFRTKDGVPFIGGSFDGSVVNKDGTITASQTVNPDTLETIDTVSGSDKGAGVKHDVLESYEGSKHNRDTGGSGNAIANKSAYQKAHNSAANLKGSGYRRQGTTVSYKVKSRNRKNGTTVVVPYVKKGNNRVNLGTMTLKNN